MKEQVNYFIYHKLSALAVVLFLILGLPATAVDAAEAALFEDQVSEQTPLESSIEDTSQQAAEEEVPDDAVSEDVTVTAAETEPTAPQETELEADSQEVIEAEEPTEEALSDDTEETPEEEGPEESTVVDAGAGALAAVKAAAPKSDDSNTEDGRFSLAILPDTQFYSRYATEGTGNQFDAFYGSEPFKSQTQWIAEHAETYGIEMTLHLGDIVDQVNQDDQWAVANEAMAVLEEAGHSYSILPGNHDVVGGDFAHETDGDATRFDQFKRYFPEERAALNETFRGRDSSGASEYHIFESEGQEYMVVALAWWANAETLAELNAVLAAHSETPTILTSHQLINTDATTNDALPTDFGDIVWEEVISKNDQIFLTFNGHHHGATQVERTNDFGNPVHQILMDYQMAYMGGNGYMGLVEFDIPSSDIHVTTFSPWVMEKAPKTLVADDQALLTGENQTFTLDFNFTERFPNIVSGENAGATNTEALRTYITENFEAPVPRDMAPAADENDYPIVENTRAHWRMPVGVDGEIAAPGAVIEDVANGNDFTRVPLNVGRIEGAQNEDVIWSNDHHPLSSNPGSVRFLNGSRNNSTGLGYNTASWFTTADGAPINFEEFEEGYTFETFIKIDPEFTAEDNEWMQWLVREGSRANIEGYDGSEPDEPPFAWAFSNLKEVQFAYTDAKDSPNEGSAWSGEIVNLNEWLHLAVVNDPETHTVTMYVEGVPVLRNAVDTIGIASDNGKPWNLGAGVYGEEREAGFIGWVGETRLVEGVLTSDQWLTARATGQATPEAPIEEDKTLEKLAKRLDKVEAAVGKLAKQNAVQKADMAELNKQVQATKKHLAKANRANTELVTRLAKLEDKVASLETKAAEKSKASKAETTHRITDARAEVAPLEHTSAVKQDAQQVVDSKAEVSVAEDMEEHASADNETDETALPSTGAAESFVFIAAILIGLGNIVLVKNKYA